MKIRSYKKLEDGVYVVSVHTEDWSEAEKSLMAKYGEPSIDIGGTFSVEYLEFTLPTQLVRVMSESPFTQRFDSRDNVDAEARALLWQQTVVGRITDTVVSLRLLGDTFTGEEVVTV